MKDVDLDNAKVVGVRREHGQLLIDLERYGSENIQVRAIGVSREDAEYYVGDRITAPHPNPTLPLDQIEVAELGKGIMELQGYLKNEPWYVWRILAENIRIIRNNNAEKAT